MPNFVDVSFEQTLSGAAFEQLQTLLQQMGHEEEAVCLTEAVWPMDPPAHQIPMMEGCDRFTLLMSRSFNTLLLGKSADLSAKQGDQALPETNRGTYAVRLIFEPEAIATFANRLFIQLRNALDQQGSDLSLRSGQERSDDVLAEQKVIQALETLSVRPNDHRAQSAFTLRLASLLTANAQTDNIRNRTVLNTAAHIDLQTDLQTHYQQKAETLEQIVADRTQELYDALFAAQAADRAKSEFLATMNHELRTPLTCVLGMSATLLRQTFGELSQRQRDYLRTIYESGEQLRDLVNDVLEISQVEAGRTILNIQQISLSHLAQQSLKSLQDDATAKQVELMLELNIAAKTDQFWVDPRRVKQILYNLLSNAVKFTPHHGKVTLRVSVKENLAILEVEDTGIGIPEEQQPLLFQKFQQLDASYQREYRGTGLGLALTKQITELHHGTIHFKSKVGKGSTFTVQLPNHHLIPAAAKKISNGPSEVELSQGRIVLIEDNEERANVICDLLTAAGYQVVWMIEESSMIEQIKLIHPIVVITDMELADADGYEIIRTLHQCQSIQPFKILALTLTNSAAEQSACRQAGADDILQKPIMPTQLLNQVAALTMNF